MTPPSELLQAAALALAFLAALQFFIEGVQVRTRPRRRDASFRDWLWEDPVYGPEEPEAITRLAYPLAVAVDRSRLRPGSFDVIYRFMCERLDVYGLDAELDRLNGLALRKEARGG